MKNIRSFGFALCALAASLMISCEKEEIIEKVPENVKTRTIAFGASCDWGAYKDVITKGGAATSGNRVDNRTLISSDSSQSLPMGIYVQDGIFASSANAENNLQTKGSVVNAANEISSFNVWAKLTTSSDKTINYFSNIAYNRNATDNIFYPVNDADEYYWPGSGSIDFIAVANTPASGFSAEQNSDGTLTGNFTYTVPADATAQPDIMVATANDIAGNNNASVPLEFRHILSAVNIKIGKVVAGEIRSIKLTGVYNKGTFNAATNRWLIDETSKAYYNVVFAGGDKFTSTGNEVAGTSVNADNATFLFIPQEPAEGAELIVEFYDKTTNRLYSDAVGAYAPALRGSIAGDIWDMAKTTNYNLSIDESFTLKIEPTGKKLDAHYIISDVNVTVDGIANWQITAKASDNAPVSILPFEEANPLAKLGFWTDHEVDKNGVEGESARGDSSYKGSGNIQNKQFILFIPENISDIDREISIILSSTEEGSTATTTKVLLQKNPNWTNNDIGWEVVDDNEVGKYGFKWTRKVSYIFPYKLGSSWIGAHYTEAEARALIQGFIDAYDAADYVTYNTFRHNLVTTRMYIQIDYTKLNNIEGATSSIDGLANTLALYDLAGSAATGAFEAAIKNTYKTESGKEGENMFRLAGDDEINEGVPAHEGSEADLSGILEYILKKNEYQLYKEYNATIGSTTYMARFNRNDLKWYLPAYGQFTGVDFTPENTSDAAGDYWSSTAVDGATYSYIGSGVQKDRDETFAVIAGRKNVNDYGTTTTTVDNSSLTGGENGNTNTWVK